MLMQDDHCTCLDNTAGTNASKMLFLKERHHHDNHAQINIIVGS